MKNDENISEEEMKKKQKANKGNTKKSTNKYLVI